MKKTFLLAITILLAMPACDRLLLGEDEALTLEEKLRVPDQLNDGLDVSSLLEENIDSKSIHATVKHYYDTQKNMRSILIARNNKLVLEAYFGGWGRERKQDIRSATKSFTSALVGIAVDKKFIAAIDQPVYSYFRQYESFQNWDQRKAGITIKDFLRMRTGLACNDWEKSSVGNENNMYKTEDWIKFVLDLPVAGTAGGYFSYCTGAPVTLGALVSQASGKSIPDFSQEYLFGPLGITDYEWKFMPNGNTDTGGHLHLRPRDMLKFGLLFLNNGNWQGEQIISAEWVAESTTPTGKTGIYDTQYGYLWWANTWKLDGREIPAYFALGNGGQVIFVIPSLQAVVVFTGGNYGKDFITPMLQLMERAILPSFK